MALDAETLKYLAVTATLASTIGLRREAALAADAALAAAPDNPDVQLLVANVKLSEGKPEEAAKLLEERLLLKSPDRSDAKAMLSLIYNAMGRTAERDRIAQEVIDLNNDANAVELARNCMQETPAA